MKRHEQARLTDTERMTFLKRELLRTLGNLASPAQGQIDYLQNLFRSMKQDDDWVCADELALEYCDTYIGSCGEPEKGYPGWRHELGLTQEQINALGAIDAKLGLMGGEANSDLWRGLALKQSPHWQEVRMLAVTCLNLFEGHQWPLDPALNSKHSDATEQAKR